MGMEQALFRIGSKMFLLGEGWRDQAHDQEMLYDLIFDPHEAHNIVADPAASGILEEMRARLDGWMKETDDPLVDSYHVKAPRGSKVNNVDGRSPREEPETID